MQINKAVFSCSFTIVALCGQLAAADYTSLSKKVHEAKTTAQAQAALNEDPKALEDSRLSELADGPSTPKQLEAIQDAVDLRAKLESGATPPDVAKTAQKIKTSRLYQDPTQKKQSNWLSDAWENFSKLFDRQIDTPKAPNLAMGNPFPILTAVMYGLLATALIAFAWFAIRYFTYSSRLRRKATAILEDDEPERTLDEWLAMASQLEAEGKYREAVRCLYLACLMRFDESGVARFVRGETNWEHLHRIRASRHLPVGLDFTEPTRAFDHIWYGYKVRGPIDVENFRGWYVHTTDLLKGTKA